MNLLDMLAAGGIPVYIVDERGITEAEILALFDRATREEVDAVREAIKEKQA